MRLVFAFMSILSMLATPQFADYTDDAVRTFDANCQTIVVAISLYQTVNNGEFPPDSAALDEYINGGFDSLQNHPAGATYAYVGPTTPGEIGYLTATYTDDAGNPYLFQYPST